jgi:hypothetical protein
MDLTVAWETDTKLFLTLMLHTYLHRVSFH